MVQAARLITALILAVTGFCSCITLETSCACYGNDGNLDSVTPDCSETGGVIGIVRFYRGTKLKSSGCPQATTNGTRDIETCCTFDASTNDCRVDVDQTNEGYSACTGRTRCRQQVTWALTPSSCNENDTHHTSTNYMCMEYYCFQPSDMASLCDTSATLYTGSSLHIRNYGYPAAITQNGCCACSINATLPGATVLLRSVDFRLYNTSTACLQTVEITDDNNTSNFSCENNNLVIQTLYASEESSVSVNLKSESTATGNGRLWIWAEVSEGTMELSCGDFSLTADDTTSATNDTASSDSGDTGGYTFLLVLAILVFIIFLCFLGWLLWYCLVRRRNRPQPITTSLTVVEPSAPDVTYLGTARDSLVRTGPAPDVTYGTISVTRESAVDQPQRVVL